VDDDNGEGIRDKEGDSKHEPHKRRQNNAGAPADRRTFRLHVSRAFDKKGRAVRGGFTCCELIEK